MKSKTGKRIKYTDEPMENVEVIPDFLPPPEELAFKEEPVKNDRIVSNPRVLGGKPCVKGTRIPVYVVLELVEANISFDEIRARFYPQLSEDDIKACAAYAHR